MQPNTQRHPYLWSDNLNAGTAGGLKNCRKKQMETASSTEKSPWLSRNGDAAVFWGTEYPGDAQMLLGEWRRDQSIPIDHSASFDGSPLSRPAVITERLYPKAGCFSELSPLSEEILLHETHDFLAHCPDQVPPQAVFGTSHLLQLRERHCMF